MSVIAHDLRMFMGQWESFKLSEKSFRSFLSPASKWRCGYQFRIAFARNMQVQMPMPSNPTFPWKKTLSRIRWEEKKPLYVSQTTTISITPWRHSSQHKTVTRYGSRHIWPVIIIVVGPLMFFSFLISLDNTIHQLHLPCKSHSDSSQRCRELVFFFSFSFFNMYNWKKSEKNQPRQLVCITTSKNELALSTNQTVPRKKNSERWQRRKRRRRPN